MISASSLNAASSPHGHSLSNKPSPMPLALENGRLRVDSQKFLIPSLPVSSRGINGSAGENSGKRRERSIINGTAIPSENHHHHQNHLSNHHHTLGVHGSNLNGIRRSSSYNHIQNHSGSHNGSTSNGQQHLSPHYSTGHLNTSPRKDAHSPMYAGEVSNSGNYPGRSSMPIPCSSPSPASSASPKSSNQSHSPNTSVSPSSRNYSSPQLPVTSILPSGVNVSNLVPDLSSLSSTANRLYPGGFHGLGTHPGVPPPPHISSAFYAAAAAAAAHSIPYPLFGAHPYSHATGSYLDNFHSNLLVPPSLRSPSAPSNSSQQSPRSHSSYLPQHQQHLAGPLNHSTTTTSLHTKLIESVSPSSERHSHNHHHQQQQHRDLHGHGSHGHLNTTNSHSQQQQNYNRYLVNGIPGMAKGGPLGIGMGIGATVPNLPPPALSAQHKLSHSENSNKSSLNGPSSSSKMWIDSVAPATSLGNSCRDGNVTPAESNVKQEKETDANKDANKVPFGKEGSLKHRILTRSPDDLTATIPPKVSKSISFAEFNGSHSHNHSSSLSNGRSHHHSERSTSNSHSQINGYHHQQSSHVHYPSSLVTTSVSGVLVDSNNAKHGNTNHLLSHNGKHSNNNNNNPFLPPSPKKRSAPWNFAVPPTKIDLPPPQPVSSHSSSIVNSGESKYLSQNHKPSNQNSKPNSPYLSPTAQQSNPNSPTTKNEPITANSPGKSQFPTKENGKARGNGNKQRSSSSSSSNSDSSAGNAVPVEAMPVLNAFKRGSLIQLANGELRPVEDLQTEDFLQAAAITSEATKIIHCTVLSIAESDSQLCKVTLTMGSLKQQVVMESTPEQPFFVLGRGWSSSSPLTTQKLLQLPCTPLAVGDICITLSRVKNGLKTSQLPPKSPCVKTKGNSGGVSKGRNGNGTTASTTNTAKSSRLSTSNNNSSSTAVTSNKSSRKTATNNIGNGKSSSVSVTMSNGGNLSSAMLPPPSPLSLTSPKSSMNNSLPVVAADENERPSSPKKRRWSAPVDNVPDVEVDKDNLTKKENPTVRIKT